jgi:hypothetical protein
MVLKHGAWAKKGVIHLRTKDDYGAYHCYRDKYHNDEDGNPINT